MSLLSCQEGGGTRSRGRKRREVYFFLFSSAGGREDIFTLSLPLSLEQTRRGEGKNFGRG